MLSVFFLEPVGSFALWHAVDLIKIELYALVATCSVIAFAHLGNMVIAAWANTESLKRLKESKSILLRELAHSVANNLVALIVNELVTNAVKYSRSFRGSGEQSTTTSRGRRRDRNCCAP